MGRYLILSLLLVSVVAMLSGCAAKSLAANDAFSYACAAGGECAVYLTITNPSREADTLMGTLTEVADRTELHRLTIDEQGALGMQQIENIPLPASGAVELKPGSMHIMLYELNKELKAGDTFLLTLLYEKGGEHAVEVLVMPKH